ncbi:DCC1-like thiol-disulfide oxidoreductase family protein [Rubritalea marina]|uniref:DCC1-like thiol-disulfide oxidoreductase family protein n=1 Tax=Rubritalea marina TaxID=361055 RepID=UPI0003716125|nr:DCC1-like thiol-disulfide oxidoreductase family protein [Rubritalea marina]
MNHNSTAFSLFRILFGTYLLIHFAQLLPYAEELFSYSVIFSDTSPSPFQGMWPNPLFSATPHLASAMVSLGCLASICIIVGRLRKTAAFYLWYLSTCLFTANPLISNPSQAYTGLLLIFLTLIPHGETWVLNRPESADWHFPSTIKKTAWLLLAIGYSFSGILKLSSPSWCDGSALAFVLENPLARPNGLRELMLSFPPVFLMLLTWFTLALEILFLPLALIKQARPWLWLATVAMHIGIMCVIDFADLSCGMLLFHLFTFQRDWLPARRGTHILFVDGACSFCHSSIKVLTRLDPERALSFSTLQGLTAQQYQIQDAGQAADAAVLLEHAGAADARTWRGADAILRSLYLAGGYGSLIWALHYLPQFLKNKLYQVIANHRYSMSTLCPIPTQEQRQQLLP